MKKKVLIIAQQFPPVGGIGVHRVTKFVKYLPSFGWQPIVLTISPDFYSISDHSFLKDISNDVEIHRTKYSNHDKLTNKGLEWLPFALLKAIKLQKIHNFNAVYITGNPYMPFLVGYFINKLFNVPYILDFRDAWTLSHYLPLTTENKNWRGRLYSKIVSPKSIEKLVIRNADKVIFVSEETRQDHIVYYKNENKDKFTVITNGFDADDVFVELGMKNKNVDGVLNISHIGNFARYRTPYNLINAVNNIIDEDHNYKKNFIINFVGGYFNDIDVKEEVEILTAKYSGSFNLIGIVPHNEAIKWLKDADVLLLITGGNRKEQPAKIFEYIATGKPIFALAPENGATAKVLRDAGTGIIVPYDNPQKIAAGLKKLISAIKMKESPRPRWEGILKYERKNLTGQLADIFNQVTNTT